MKTKERPKTIPPMPLYADTHTFIVRVWQESARGTAGGSRWRGLITHVGNNRQQYFLDTRSIVHFIEQQTGSDRRTPLPWWRSILDWFQKGRK